jgi:hypothetical protein
MELQPELDNRCFQTKTAAEQWKFLQELDALPESDFKKTIADLNSINAADRLVGTQGLLFRTGERIAQLLAPK